MRRTPKPPKPLYFPKYTNSAAQSSANPGNDTSLIWRENLTNIVGEAAVCALFGKTISLILAQHPHTTGLLLQRTGQKITDSLYLGSGAPFECAMSKQILAYTSSLRMLLFQQQTGVQLGIQLQLEPFNTFLPQWEEFSSSMRGQETQHLLRSSPVCIMYGMMKENG